MLFVSGRELSVSKTRNEWGGLAVLSSFQIALACVLLPPRFSFLSKDESAWLSSLIITIIYWVPELLSLLHTLSYLIFRKILGGKCYLSLQLGNRALELVNKQLTQSHTTISGRNGVWAKLMLFTTTTLSPSWRLSSFLAQVLSSTYFLKPSVTHSVLCCLCEECAMVISSLMHSKPVTTAPLRPVLVSGSQAPPGPCVCQHRFGLSCNSLSLTPRLPTANTEQLLVPNRTQSLPFFW